MKRHIITLLATLAAFVAVTSAAGACFWIGYQPKTPKSLMR